MCLYTINEVKEYTEKHTHIVSLDNTLDLIPSWGMIIVTD